MPIHTVLVAPGVAPHASALSVRPHLALRAGQLLVVEPGTGADPLRQPIRLLVPVPALGLVLVQTDDELYLLPLAGLSILGAGGQCAE